MSFPSTASYRSRMLIPSDGLKYKTLTASDFVYTPSAYTTFTGVANGTDIDVTLAGNKSTTSMTECAFATCDLQIPTDPTNDERAAWLCNIYMSFDTSSFSGSEDQNLGVFFMTGAFDALVFGVSTGTGFMGGGRISSTSGTNRSLDQFTRVNTKNASSLTPSGDTVTTATKMAMTAQIIRYGNGGTGSLANKITTSFANMVYGNASGWDTTFKDNSTNLQVGTGNNLQLGFWASRSASGSFTHNFTINEFSYCLLNLVP